MARKHKGGRAQQSHRGVVAGWTRNGKCVTDANNAQKHFDSIAQAKRYMRTGN